MNKILRTILSLIALIYMGNVFATTFNNEYTTATMSKYIYLTKNSGYSISNSNSYPAIISSNSLAKCNMDPNRGVPTGCMYLDAPESAIGHYDTGAASYLYAHAITIIGGYAYIVSQDTSKAIEKDTRDVTWIQYCKVSSTDGSLSDCTNISAGNNNVTPGIITSIASATIGGSNYVYIGGDHSLIYVDEVNSDGSLKATVGHIYFGDSGFTSNLIRDIDVDVSNMVLYFTRGPASNSAYYIEYLPLASATTTAGNATDYARPDTQPYPYGILSYSGNVYASTFAIASGSESYGITMYDGGTAPANINPTGYIESGPFATNYPEPQGLENYTNSSGTTRTFVAFQGWLDNNSVWQNAELQSCNFSAVTPSCTVSGEAIYSGSTYKTTDTNSPYLENVYDIAVYPPLP